MTFPTGLNELKSGIHPFFEYQGRMTAADYVDALRIGIILGDFDLR